MTQPRPKEPSSSAARQRFAALAALLALAVASCTRPVSMDGQWTEGAARDRTFRHVLVVGLTKDFETRCRFERSMAEALRSDQVDATASCTLMSSKTELTRDNVVPVVAQVGADGVLTAQLVSKKVDYVEGGSNETRGRGYYKATDIGYGYAPSYYGAYGLPVTVVELNFVTDDPLATFQRTVTVASAVYDASGGGKMVYSMETTVRKKESRVEVLLAVTDAVAARMQKEGLVRR
jgi:hypothetical protein